MYKREGGGSKSRMKHFAEWLYFQLIQPPSFSLVKLPVTKVHLTIVFLNNKSYFNVPLILGTGIVIIPITVSV